MMSSTPYTPELLLPISLQGLTWMTSPHVSSRSISGCTEARSSIVSAFSGKVSSHGRTVIRPGNSVLRGSARRTTHISSCLCECLARAADPSTSSSSRCSVISTNRRLRPKTLPRTTDSLAAASKLQKIHPCITHQTTPVRCLASYQHGFRAGQDAPSHDHWYAAGIAARSGMSGLQRLCTCWDSFPTLVLSRPQRERALDKVRPVAPQLWP